MFHRTSTPVMDGMCGPLVSRQERPLILPARLNVSSPLRPNCTPSATPRGQFTRRGTTTELSYRLICHTLLTGQCLYMSVSFTVHL